MLGQPFRILFHKPNRVEGSPYHLYVKLFGKMITAGRIRNTTGYEATDEAFYHARLLTKSVARNKKYVWVRMGISEFESFKNKTHLKAPDDAMHFVQTYMDLLGESFQSTLSSTNPVGHWAPETRNHLFHSYFDIAMDFPTVMKSNSGDCMDFSWFAIEVLDECISRKKDILWRPVLENVVIIWFHYISALNKLAPLEIVSGVNSRSVSHFERTEYLSYLKNISTTIDALLDFRIETLAHSDRQYAQKWLGELLADLYAKVIIAETMVIFGHDRTYFHEIWVRITFQVSAISTLIKQDIVALQLEKETMAKEIQSIVRAKFANWQDPSLRIQGLDDGELVLKKLRYEVMNKISIHDMENALQRYLNEEFLSEPDPLIANYLGTTGVQENGNE